MTATDTTDAAGVKISLAAIVADTKLWPRRELDVNRVKEFKEIYEADPSVLPPVVLAPAPASPSTAAAGSKNGASTKGPRYYLVDGWHRLEAQRRIAGKADTKIPAQIREDLTTREAIYREAVRLSATSAKPLTRAEKNEAVRRIMGDYPQLSDREIGRLAGCSHTFVAKQRNPVGRLFSKIGDAMANAADSNGASSGSGSSAPAERSIEDRLVTLLYRDDAGELTAEGLAVELGNDAQGRQMAAAWGLAMVRAVYPDAQVRRPTAPAS